MKIVNAIFSTFLISLVGSVSFAGVGSSGGGKSVVCRDRHEQITKATVLDIYEAIHLDGIKIRTPYKTLDQEYMAFLKEMRRISHDDRPVTSDDLVDFHKQLREYFVFLPEGVVLDSIDDVGETIEQLPEDCELEQLAVYIDEEDRIYINTEIWNSLDSLNRMAIIAHEILYNMYRNVGEETSEKVRKIVPRLFSQTQFPAQKEGVPENALSCWTNLDQKESATSQFYVYQKPYEPNVTYFQFTRILGRYTFSLLRVQIPTFVDLNQTKIEYINDMDFALYPTDESANFHDQIPLDGVFTGHHVEVRFNYNEPFTLALIDKEGNVVEQAPVSYCYFPDDV